MSSTEDIECKTGRTPATKIGGVRQARHRTTSEDVKNPPPAEEVEEEGEGEEDEETRIKNKEKAKLNLWGEERDPSKDYPSSAIQHMQNKPVPTKEQGNKPQSVRPNNIHQPR